MLTPVCQLRALDLASGDVKVACRPQSTIQLGAASRPLQASALLDGDRIILHSGAADDHRTLALSAKTGEPIWTAKGVARSTYASPAIATIGGERLLLVQHVDATDPAAPRGGFTALRSKDGSVAWHTTIDQNWSWEVPVALGGDRVLFLTWNDVTAFRAPAAGQTAPQKLWQTADLRATASPPVLHGDHLYGFSGDFLTAVRASDGVKVWAEKLYPGSLVLADGHLIVMSAVSGVLRIVEASPAGYKERASLEEPWPAAREQTRRPASPAGGSTCATTRRSSPIEVESERSFRTSVRPSATGIITDCTRRSPATCSLKSRSATVSASRLAAFTMSPLQRTLSTAMSPLRRRRGRISS